MHRLLITINVLISLLFMPATMSGEAPTSPASAAMRCEAARSYAVVVSEETDSVPEWRRVVDALRQKHDGACILYSASVEEARAALAEIMPR